MLLCQLVGIIWITWFELALTIEFFFLFAFPFSLWRNFLNSSEMYAYKWLLYPNMLNLIPTTPSHSILDIGWAVAEEMKNIPHNQQPVFSLSLHPEAVSICNIFGWLELKQDIYTEVKKILVTRFLCSYAGTS